MIIHQIESYLVAAIIQFYLEEIESVTVLKDALGTAMPGVRGAQGAIVVTTRKGKANKQLLSFTVQTALQKPIGEYLWKAPRVWAGTFKPEFCKTV